MKYTQRQPKRHEKRGTVLIFAIGSLAVISIIALSYVSVVRIERSSSAAVTRQSNRGDSVDIIVNEIKAILTADLFGNKIVTTATPSSIGIGREAVRVTPRMFEDGEFYDYPSVDAIDLSLNPSPTSRAQLTFDTRFFRDPNNPPPVPSAAIGTKDLFVLSVEREGIPLRPDLGRRYETARPDDAWLATTEPEYHAPMRATIALVPWRNITNLRSAYRWVQRERGQTVQLWEIGRASCRERV